MAEPNAQTRAYNSQAFPTFTPNWGKSANPSWTSIAFSLAEDSQRALSYLEKSEYEASQARLQDAFLRASINAMRQPEVGIHATLGSAASEDASAASNIMRGSGVVRGRSARRARGTTARRVRGGAAQRGHLEDAMVEHELSDKIKSKRRKHDEDKESGA